MTRQTSQAIGWLTVPFPLFQVGNHGRFRAQEGDGAGIILAFV